MSEHAQWVNSVTLCITFSMITEIRNSEQNECTKDKLWQINEQNRLQKYQRETPSYCDKVKYKCERSCIMRAVLKVMPPILLCWHTTLEADVGGMAAEVEPSHQYPITFCCRVKDDSRGAVWQNGIGHGSVYEAKVWHWIPPRGKHGTHRHSLMLAERFWRPNSGCEHSEAAGGAFQQRWQWAICAGAD